MGKENAPTSSNIELGTKVDADKVSEWYNRVIKEAGLVDQGPARGTIVLRPYGYAPWKRIQTVLGSVIEAQGVQDAYFPAIIPEAFLTREKEHVEGFAPEFLRVHGRDGVIGVLRPTSEAAMYPLFAKWIHSYRDLPLKINQWCNIFRDELRTYAFMRTSEFLWQEGHCVYASKEENEEAVIDFLRMYENFFRETLALVPVFGKKSEKEKFAGAFYTTTGEAMLPNGKALQVCTSHNLGTNFSKAFGIRFLGKDGKLHYAYQTSWGLSWRAIGAAIITHGDKKGIIFPPEIAPTQVVIVPIKGEATGQVLEVAETIQQALTDLRIEVDNSDERPGARYNYHELRGVPLRIEIGPRDVRNRQVVLANRLTGEKNTSSLGNLKETIYATLNSIQRELLKRAQRLVEDSTHDVKTWKEFKEILRTTPSFLRTYHCGNRECEQKIQDETKATLRCIPFGYEKSDDICIRCGNSSGYGQKVLFAKAY
jgi:prolyl-tRNA synthetase